MSKRQIERALKAKGIECAELWYGHAVSPGEMVGGWEIVLSEDSVAKVRDVDPDFDEFPDCFNAAEVLEWVETLPNLREA